MGLTSSGYEKVHARITLELRAMTPLINQWGPVAVIVVGYLLGIYFQSRSIAHLDRRIDDLRDSINRRLDDLRDLLKSVVKRLEERFDRVDERFDRVEERLERLEHAIVRQS